jgi:hypothetical protein
MSEPINRVAEPDRAHLMVVQAAWQMGTRESVEGALASWASAAPVQPLEYWLQRVYADAFFERATLAASVRNAERLARSAGDEIALARIGASVVDALYSDWLPSRDARQWLDVLRGVTYARLAALPASQRLEIAAGVLAADLFGEALSTAAQTAESVASWADGAADVSATLRGNALGYALEHFSGQRRWQPAHELVKLIDKLHSEPGFSAAGRARVSARRGFYYHYRRGDYFGALAQSNVAVAQAKLAGVTRASREAGITVTLCHLMRGEADAAESALAREQAAIPEGYLMLRANVHYERSWLHALRRDVVAAQRELDTACRLFAEIDEHGVMSLATPSLQAQLLVQVGEFDAALNGFEMRMRRPDAWLVDMAMIDAIRALSHGNEVDAIRALRRGLAIAARIDIKGCFWACREELARLLHVAIRENIEPEWVRSVSAARLIKLD